jgi:hypothetical protein
MAIALIGFGISVSSTVILLLLFSYEERRARRVFHNARVRLDVLVERIDTKIYNLFHIAGQDILRQAIHYFFHTMLSTVLRFLRRLEERVQLALRSNKVLAKKSREERTSKNKLDHIADHKASVALSDSEKKKHKDDVLSGKI